MDWRILSEKAMLEAQEESSVALTNLLLQFIAILSIRSFAGLVSAL